MLTIIIIATFCSTLLGGLFALKFKDRLHLILGFSAGAVIGVVFFDLIPEAIELGSTMYDIPMIMAIAAGGVNAAGAWASLAALYARLGRWRDCVKATYQTAMRMPRGLTDSLGRVQARCREAIESWRETRAPKRPGDAAPQLWI